MPRSTNALEVLRRDHKKVLTLFHRFEKTDDEGEQRELRDEIVTELTTHADIEEGVFYPYLRDATAREDLFEEATLEHQTTRDLLSRLQDEPAGTPRFQAMVRVLGEYVALHVKEEEGEIFPQVEKTGVDLDALGQELEDRRAGSPGTAPVDGRGDSRAEAGEGDDAGGPVTGEDAANFAAQGQLLSGSARHAKWIHTLDDRPDHDGQTLATRNPDVIMRWADERGARPATVHDADPGQPRVLRLDFPDYDSGLQEVSWQAWLDTFRERGLVFVFQDRMKAGNPSNFFHLDSPRHEEG
ncbi:hemerythrin domain-containing protein [Eleftheria terrae]|uniref:hemerythrin domain-containing protein n=1 Tax=Eleftheria terrae TaxID=1597781 RepID=UPI00263BDF29|nr:hemerythrin domain-containing protein [Eleftheria terrae]WKB51278.1 hemerythrin domain-containing protein [Eleftheria terrae]